MDAVVESGGAESEIDAHALVTGEPSRLVVPERVMARLWVAGPNGIEVAEVFQRAVGAAALGLEERIVLLHRVD